MTTHRRHDDRAAPRAPAATAAAATELALVTWNLLHRIHAENWGEDVPGIRGDEDARVAAITGRLAAWLAGGGDAFLLQEVSGDQLADLRAALAPGASVFAMRYPRVPAPRAGTTHRATLRDPGEHLVIVCRAGLAARPRAAAAFDDDPGKGYLAVELEDTGALLMSTHVTYGSRLGGQLARVAAAVGAGPGAVIIGGDFNADRAAVGAALGLAHAFALPAEPALPTRPRTDPAGKSTTIDHVIAVRARPLAAAVVDAGGLSDHNPVTARVALAG
ncbi:MAG: endonuclease/exonuclease/phosphatase family protein [Myxococcales bacterium]|nr:endonuclease/exonuclease/phosphatase family protein [Myxococcales bacterium]